MKTKTEKNPETGLAFFKKIQIQVNNMKNYKRKKKITGPFKVGEVLVLSDRRIAMSAKPGATCIVTKKQYYEKYCCVHGDLICVEWNKYDNRSGRQNDGDYYATFFDRHIK